MDAPPYNGADDAFVTTVMLASEAEAARREVQRLIEAHAGRESVGEAGGGRVPAPV